MTPNSESSEVDQPGTEKSTAGDRDGTGKEQRFREWIMIGVGLSGLMSLLAIVVAVVALADPGTQTTVVPAAQTAAATGMSSMMSGSAQPASATATAVKPQSIKLAIKSDTEHGRRGPDGKWHDAFLPAGFTVKAGAQVTVTVTNYDQSPHTFTSSTLSDTQVIDAHIAAGTASGPTTTTFTFTAPSQPGKYQWWCAEPCDPWAMSHIGYMRGIVTVTA